MKRKLIAVASLAALAAVSLAVLAGAGRSGSPDAANAAAPALTRDVIPLKEAKLNIEHNATDEDTGFQGFIDSEGWQRLTVRGPDGEILNLQSRGELADLGMTELFFETVEPANADVPLDEILETLPEGEYTFSGPAIEDGVLVGRTTRHRAADARHPGRAGAAHARRRRERQPEPRRHELGRGRRDHRRRAR